MIINHDFTVNKSTLTTDLKTTDLANLEHGLVLVVGIGKILGLTDVWQEKTRTLELTTDEFFKLCPASLTRLAPRLVLTPLVCKGSDVLDFASHLEKIGFAGHYRAVVQKLPDAKMVLREVMAVAPNVTFSVTELAGIVPFSKQAKTD